MDTWPITRLHLQWHVTERCNLRCKHCYQSDKLIQELTYQNLLDILQQFKDMIDVLRGARNSGSVKGMITVTGGEPFIRDDFLDLLNVFAENKDYFTFCILTNGTFIDRDLARKIKNFGASYVQVSLEGGKKVHDDIRGKGTFKKACTALQNLTAENVHTLISFTAHKANYREFSKVAKIGSELGVNRIWADRLIPEGRGLALKDLVMSPEETVLFFKLMEKARSTISYYKTCGTEIAMHRALQFLISGGSPYHCSAGDNFFTIQANGDLCPCRRMPICVGNVLQTKLIDLYNESTVFKKLRDKSFISKGCEGCSYTKSCGGGLRCLSYALNGDPLTKDPGCWRNS
jgi:radical SAM protein with 4Fe4S-binding SPASM domain